MFISLYSSRESESNNVGMDGLLHAMDGDGGEWLAYGFTRLLLASAMSLAIHSILFIVLMLGLNGGGGNFGVDQKVPRAALEVRLAPPLGRFSSAVELGGGRRNELVPHSLKLERQEVIKGGAGANPRRLAFTVPDSPPVLESNLVFDEIDSRISGMMILHFEISNEGVVEFAEVLHSNLPPETQMNIVTTFKGARFTPATRDGEAVGASLLMRIDVE
nr:energy transducer TonB [Dechloromonas sp.]